MKTGCLALVAVVAVSPRLSRAEEGFANPSIVSPDAQKKAERPDAADVESAPLTFDGEVLQPPSNSAFSIIDGGFVFGPYPSSFVGQPVRGFGFGPSIMGGRFWKLWHTGFYLGATFRTIINYYFSPHAATLQFVPYVEFAQFLHNEPTGFYFMLGVGPSAEIVVAPDYSNLSGAFLGLGAEVGLGYVFKKKKPRPAVAIHSWFTGMGFNLGTQIHIGQNIFSSAHLDFLCMLQ